MKAIKSSALRYFYDLEQARDRHVQEGIFDVFRHPSLALLIA